MANKEMTEADVRELESRERERQARQQGRAPGGSAPERRGGSSDAELREELEEAGRRKIGEVPAGGLEAKHVVD